MAILQLPLSPPSTTFSLLTLNQLNPNQTHFTLLPNPPLKPFFRIRISLKPSCGIQNSLKPSFRARNSVKPSSHPSASPFTSLQPFIQSQWYPILKGWSCSLLSAICLSQLVPGVGRFSSSLVSGFDEAAGLRNQGLVFGVLFLVRANGHYWQQAFLWEAALSTVYNVRLHAFRGVLEKDLAFFEGGDSLLPGDIAHRITVEASEIADAIYALLNAAVPCTSHLCAMATQMLAISPVLSFISALVIPCMAFIISHLGERLRKISKNTQVSIARISSYLNEVFPSILFVKANNSEASEGARFQRLAYVDLCERLKKRKMKSLIPQIVQIAYFGSLSLLCVCSLVVSQGSISRSSIVSFVTSLVFLIEPIQGIEKAYNEWKQAEPAIERLFDLARFASEVIDNPEAVDLDCIKGELKFCNISFRYGNNMPFVLNELDLHIDAGETVALVGPSGGGKTTLVKLLLRLYDPFHGCILLDNYNIQGIQLESLRKNISLVSQDIMLFSGTVAENIGYRDLMGKIDMEKVENAAHTANLDEFIRSLPQGYRTNIGPRGSILSGGQKQRLAIARALYKDSSILILDEATSALDSRSELLVRQALERVMKNHTVIIIAHRLETLLMANRVFCLSGGKLEELTRASLLDGLHITSAATDLMI